MPWKKVELPLSMFASGADLIDLEELDDYNPDEFIKMNKEEKTPKEKKEKKTGVKRKTKPVQSKSSDRDEDDMDDFNESDSDKHSDDENRKKKKKPAKKTNQAPDSGKKDRKQAIKKPIKPKVVIAKADVYDVNAEAAKEAESESQPNEEEAKPLKNRVLTPNTPLSSIEEAKVKKAMKKWKKLDLPIEILKALCEDKFFEPTEIQKQAIPAALTEYRDVIGAAETGSGKTLSYGLPLLSHIFRKIQQESVEDGDKDPEKAETLNQRPMGLVLVPTRELAVQVKQHLDSAGRHCTNVRTGLIVGGLSVAKQQRILSLRPAILVATPGRLWQLVREKAPGLEQISSVRHLVVDEADRIVERAHFAELKSLIQHINEHQPERQKRQTLLFSATLTFAQYDLQKRETAPAVLQEKLRHLMESLSMKNRPKIVDLSPAGTTTRSLVEAKVVCEGGDVEKDAVLYSILTQYPGRTLIFANAISTVRKISNMLRLLFSPPAFSNKKKKRHSAPTRPILALHAQLRQRVRLKYLDKFREDPNSILVASDVAARGLDIPNIEHVIHYHVPNNTESYVHRSGRTARLSTEGLSILLVDPSVEAGRFWRLMGNLCRRATTDEAKVAEVADFEIDQKLLAQCRDRVGVCRQLESLKHQQKKHDADKKWAIDGGSDFESSSSSGDSDDDVPAKETQQSREIRQLEIRLAQLLATPLKVRSGVAMTRYPTQLGQAISLETTSNALTGTKPTETRSAIEHIAQTSKKGSMAKTIATAAKIEKRREKRQEKADAKNAERMKRKNEKRNLKRKKRDEKDGGSNNGFPAIPEGKEFVFY